MTGSAGGTLYDRLADKGLCRGSVVLSLAGHDRGWLYVVIRVDGGWAWILDGQGRPWERPKRKRIRHLKPLSDAAGRENQLDRIEADPEPERRNAAIRRMLREFVGERPGAGMEPPAGTASETTGGGT